MFKFDRFFFLIPRNNHFSDTWKWCEKIQNSPICHPGMGKGSTGERIWGRDERVKLYIAISFTKLVIERKIQNDTWFVHKTKGVGEGENGKTWHSSKEVICRMTMYIKGFYLYHSSLALSQNQIHLNIGSYLEAKSWERGSENRDHLCFVILTSSVVKYLVCIGHCGGYLPTVLHWVHITAPPGKCLQGVLHPMTT